MFLGGKLSVASILLGTASFLSPSRSKRCTHEGEHTGKANAAQLLITGTAKTGLAFHHKSPSKPHFSGLLIKHQHGFLQHNLLCEMVSFSASFSVHKLKVICAAVL